MADQPDRSVPFEMRLDHASVGTVSIGGIEVQNAAYRVEVEAHVGEIPKVRVHMHASSGLDLAFPAEVTVIVTEPFARVQHPTTEAA